MDEDEVNLIIHQYSPVSFSYMKREPSPNSVATYSLNTRMVNLCKNCKFTFRIEFNPTAQFCCKGTAITYTFMYFMI